MVQHAGVRQYETIDRFADLRRTVSAVSGFRTGQIGNLLRILRPDRISSGFGRGLVLPGLKSARRLL